MANVTRYDPFNELVEDLFKGFFVRPVYEGRGAEPRVKIEVSENEGGYVVHAELPGVRKEDIDISIDGAQVTLATEFRREKEVGENERVLHSERAYGKLARSFELPQELDETKAEAKFRDGVLELKLPKKGAALRKQIAVQ